MKELIEAAGGLYRAAIRQQSGYIFSNADLRGPASRQVRHASSFEDVDAVFRAMERSSPSLRSAGRLEPKRLNLLSPIVGYRPRFVFCPWQRYAEAVGNDRTGSRFSRLREIPQAVWALGFVSLLMDISSEVIHALLPVYLVTVLGASMVTVGFIEGIAEATASITKVFSGALSDWLGKRKLLAVIGYGLAAFTKPIFPLAPSVGWLVAARFIDRIGKGIRGAPRDALVADIAPAHLRGASFGLRQSLDTVGAFVGPALAIGLMWVTANNFQAVFWVAVIPAFLAVALLVFAVDEPERPSGLRQVKSPLSVTELRRLGSVYWWIVGTAVVFSLARFSEAFLILRAQAVGLPVMLVPLVLVLMNFVYALAAYPAGALSDRANRISILGAGLGFLIAADLVLAFTNGIAGVAVGVALWGLHMGFTQGLLATLVADTAPPELRGTAYGVFNLLSGLALLVASVLAGALWQSVGPQSTFLAGALFAVLALAGLAATRRIEPAVGRRAESD